MRSALFANVGAGKDSGRSDYRLLRVTCWFVALALGAAQAWATRFTMNPDGVSYLDIGDAYWRGDWHNAVNAYWSPLYSWILGFFMKVVKPKPYWEYPLAHLVNFLIYVGALACFEHFLATFIASKGRRSQAFHDGETGLPEPAWWLLGYSIFVSSTLILIGLDLLTPDICVAAFIYISWALILKVYHGAPPRRTLPVIGGVLGLAYLAKAVMFPLGIVLLLAAVWAARKNAGISDMTSAVAFYLSISAPFLFMLSHSKHRPTFGDSGAVTYEIFVNNVDVFIPNSPDLLHPVAQISSNPLVHEFREPIQGTYPPWFDPSYWHEGIKPRFNLKRQCEMALFGLFTYARIACSIFLQLNFSVGLLLLYLMSPAPSRCFNAVFRNITLLIPLLLALVAYALVYTEPRYVAPFFSILWMTLFSGVHFPNSPAAKHMMTGVVLVLATTSVLSVLLRTLHDVKAPIPDYVKAIPSVQGEGLAPGSQIAVVASEPWGPGGAFLARLMRARIIAQSRDLEDFQHSEENRKHLFILFAKSGARGTLIDLPPPDSSRCAKGLGKTRYSYCPLKEISP